MQSTDGYPFERPLTGPGDGAPYDGADLRAAQLFGCAAWAFGLIVMLVLAVGDPPTAVIGNAGWWVLGAMLSALPAFVALLATGRASFRGILAQQYVGAGCIAVAQWLAGGWTSPYHQVFAALMMYAGFVHPRTRSLPLVGLCAVLTLLPAAYAPTAGQLVPVLLSLLMWLGLAGFATQLITMVRQQRVELARRGDAAWDDARRDPLTGLANRRAFLETIAQELARSRAEGRRIGLALGDVDSFKSVNDLFGHVAGDACLAAIGQALRGVTRGSETVFRWGGDEFAVLLDGGDATAACGRLETAVSQSVRDPAGRPVTVTIGFVQDDGHSAPARLVEAADAALLARKALRQAFADGPARVPLQDRQPN